MQTTAIRTKSYGPFEVIGEITSGDGRVFLQLPFQEVVGCRVILAVVDNFSQLFNTGDPMHLWPGVEITIWGNVQGYESLIKRQCVHMQTGPMGVVLDGSEGWDTVSFRGRNAQGGSFHEGTFLPLATQDNGYSLKVSVYAMPRSGFATPGASSGPSQFAKAG